MKDSIESFHIKTIDGLRKSKKDYEAKIVEYTGEIAKIDALITALENRYSAIEKEFGLYKSELDNSMNPKRKKKKKVVEEPPISSNNGEAV